MSNDNGGRATPKHQAEGVQVLTRLASERPEATIAFPAPRKWSPQYAYDADPDVIRLPRGVARQAGLHAATLILAVVLSVIATITILAVLTGGVYLPQYSRYNQPTQVSQLGLCVSRHGQITTPSGTGTTCPHGSRFVHVQPAVTHP